MANQFIAINQGSSGRKQSDFTVGSASAAGIDMEFRMATPTAGGNALTRKDVDIALNAIRNFILSNFGNLFPPL